MQEATYHSKHLDHYRGFFEAECKRATTSSASIEAIVQMLNESSLQLQLEVQFVAAECIKIDYTCLLSGT